MLYVLLLILIVILIGVASIRIVRTGTSRFELERRANVGDEAAHSVLRREAFLPDLLSLQRAAIALCIIVISLLSVVVFGWVIGVFAALLISLCYGLVSRQAGVNKFVQKYYEKSEPKLLEWIEKAPFVFSLLRSVTVESAADPELRSKEQLLHLVDQSQDIFNATQKTLIKHGLSFGAKLVSDIMTPRSVIDSIEARELLGPLVLDDLHKTGHSRFPVVEGDIDHVVGMLHIRDLLTLDAGKNTTTATKAMEKRVFYIKQTQTLEHALAAFLKTHHHLFVVVNEYRETVGLLSLEDVIETLLGREIVDEFDTHEDLRVVAERNPRSNNDPVAHTDV
ncbi:CBS domain-containing protein [Candidatus Saccharibacteria bacterium]|nr:CBS domain-containing protein [Candidatus Saccharibacteria bacterium]